MKRKRPSILVNDIAAVTGGALSILKQFLREVSLSSLAQEFEWYVFVGSSELERYEEFEHIHVVNMDKQSYLKRFSWLSKEIWNWTKVHGVDPAVAVSLMNVGFRNFTGPKVVYVHQPLPFGDYRSFKWYEWKPWIKRLLLPIEIKMTIDSKTTFVVQTDWMKLAVSTKLGIPIERIHVFRPVVACDESVYRSKSPAVHKNKVFYPSVPGTSYKNHELLLRMLQTMKSKNPELYSRIKLSFTCKPDDNRLTKYYYRLSKKLSVDERIEWKGYLSKDEMLREYIASDIVLFPSKLETFGLPLAEAASLGKPVFVLDKPYAHDVLSKYSGVYYLEDEPSEWSRRMEDFFTIQKKVSFEPLISDGSNGWKDFFDLVTSKVQSSFH